MCSIRRFRSHISMWVHMPLPPPAGHARASPSRRYQATASFRSHSSRDVTVTMNFLEQIGEL